eukprot:4075310-Prymnesium_polylepis.1
MAAGSIDNLALAVAHHDSYSQFSTLREWHVRTVARLAAERALRRSYFFLESVRLVGVLRLWHQQATAHKIITTALQASTPVSEPLEDAGATPERATSR